MLVIYLILSTLSAHYLMTNVKLNKKSKKDTLFAFLWTKYLALDCSQRSEKPAEKPTTARGYLAVFYDKTAS